MPSGSGHRPPRFLGANVRRSNTVHSDHRRDGCRPIARFVANEYRGASFTTKGIEMASQRDDEKVECGNRAYRVRLQAVRSGVQWTVTLYSRVKVGRRSTWVRGWREATGPGQAGYWEACRVGDRWLEKETARVVA
jgi:hypothetical protein